MREAQQLVHINTMTLPAPKPEFISRTLRAAWLAILLGCFVEALLVLAASFGEVQSIKPFVAELTQKISWSVIVCAALACGTAANRMRAGVMGIVGMLSGPIAFHVARSFHIGCALVLFASESLGTRAVRQQYQNAEAD